MAKTLAELGKEVDEWCKTKGWRSDPSMQHFLTHMFLLGSEVVEAGEAWRINGLESWYSESAETPGVPKPEGVASEFADVLIRLLDDAALYGVDLEAAYEEKMAYNRIRPWRNGGKKA